jgi:hypothetical protein
LYSQDLTQSGQWLTLANAVVSGTTVISPDGTQNANQVIYDGITASCRVEQVIGGVTSGADYTFSVYMRVASGTATVEIGHGSTTVAQTVTTTWQRFSVTQIPIAGTSYPRIMCNFAKTVEIWGAQLEASSYPTSYIPTTSASATRVADVAQKTGISSLIGQTSGSVFMDFTVDTISAQTNDPVLWYMKGGGTGERYVQLLPNGNIQYIEFNGAIIASIIKSGLTVGRHKYAIAYANNDMTFYVDGVQIGTDTSGTPSGFSEFGFQYYNATFNGEQKVNQAVIFPTRLTNAELASLTTI